MSGIGFLGGGVILRQGFTVQGLNTAATLWCSAAAGCQAATGHTIPALTLTGVVLAVHLLLRPLGRLLDHAPAGGQDDVSAYQLDITVRRKNEPRLRAQLLQALTDLDITLRGLTTDIPDDDVGPNGGPDNGHRVLRADLLLPGNSARPLDALTTRLSLEAGVRTIAWHDQHPDTTDSDDTDDAAPRRRRRRRAT